MKGVILTSMASGISGVLLLGLPMICVPITVLAGCLALGVVMAADWMEAEEDEDQE